MADQASETSRASPLPRALTILLGLAAAMVVILGARELAWLIGPVFLALVIVLLVHPLHTWLRHKKVPEGVALVACCCWPSSASWSCSARSWCWPSARLVTVLPQYAAEADGLVNGLREFLSRRGSAARPRRPLLADVSIGAVVQALTPLLSGVVGLVANAIFLLSLMLFLGIDATGALGRMAAQPAQAAAGRRVPASRQHPPLPRGDHDLRADHRHRGHPAAAVAGHPAGDPVGLLAAICNYIPYVGFVIGLVPPALLALLIGDWPLMLVVIVAYIVLNSLFTSLIQPYFIGDAVGVSVTVTLWRWCSGAGCSARWVRSWPSR